MCFLVVGAGAAVGSRLMTPIYQSTALVQVDINLGNTQVDYYTSLLASEQLVQTDAVLATSDPVLREVASHYPGLTVEQLSKEVSATPRPNTQLFEIDVRDPRPMRAAALANDIAKTLIKQQLQNIQSSFLFIAQPAQPALNPVQPNIPLNTSAGLLAGLLLGMLLAVLFEQLDTRVHTPEALSQLLDWPVLAAIWQADPKEDVVNPTGHNANVEAYRILRTNIGFAVIDKPPRTLMVTSPMPRDGKTVVATNLAIFMAKAGKSTLLIDADLRHPTLHEQFGLPAHAMGFSNAVLAFSTSTTAKAASYYQFPAATSGPASSTSNTPTPFLDPFVYAVDIPNLCVMPSGPLPPNPPELLDSKAMQWLLTVLASSGVEVVIFDTPPLLGLSDASILASKVDGTLVVVDITRAHKRNLQQMKALLGQAGTHILGCVVNKQRHSRNDTIYSYYYSADEQNGTKNHRTRKVNSSAVPPVTPDALKQPAAEFRLDLLDDRKGG